MSQTSTPEVKAPPSMVNLTVDGKPVSVPKGSNVIQAAKKLGVHVPHYCYHEKLTVSGNCRMCLIEMGVPKMGPDRKPVLKPDGSPEISWIPRPQIGCATTVSEGMQVRTQTKMVEDCRKGVMEFLLINHPLDCPICDQAGECHLQEYSVEFGNGASRFLEAKEHKPKNVPLGPRVTLDDERCIMCSRCIRFSKEIAKDDVLGFTERGSHTTLGCYPGRQLDNNYSLNTVDICPVGALTSNDFRFKMRVWFLKETESVCNSCSTGCNTLVGSREDKVYRQTPRRNDAVNSDWMCDYGRLNYKWIHDSRRMTAPQIKESGTLREVDWNTALTRVSKALKEKPGTLAILGSGRSSTEELYLVKRLVEIYGAISTDIVPRTGEGDDILLSADRNPNSAGAQLMGISASIPGDRIAAIREGIEKGSIESLLVIDECAVKAGIPEKILARLRHLIVLDVLPSATTAQAHIILPGTSHVEKMGTFINRDRRLQRFLPAIAPVGKSKPDWEILLDLLPEENRTCTTFQGLFKEMTGSIQPLLDISWNQIGEEGFPLRDRIET